MEKIRLSDTEDKLVVSIPPVVRLGVVAIKLQPSAVRVQVEHIRITIAIGIVCSTIHTTTNLVHYFM